jgi:hypothetical protein
LPVNVAVKIHTNETNHHGYGSKSTNSDLAGFYLLLYIRQHAGLFRRKTVYYLVELRSLHLTSLLDRKTLAGVVVAVGGGFPFSSFSSSSSSS